MFIFDPVEVKIIWKPTTEVKEVGLMDYSFTGDVNLDAGNRSNTDSILDYGSRVI